MARSAAQRRAQLKAAKASAAKRRKRGGKKPYAKRVGSRNRNGKFASKNQRRKNVARKVGTGVAVAAYVGLHVAAASSARSAGKANRAKISGQAARKVKHYNGIAASARGR